MNPKTPEQERKDLNKTLIKRTFTSELKEKKSGKFKKILINFVFLFLAFLAADLITAQLPIDFWLLDMGITVVLVMIVQVFTEKLKDKIS